MTTVTRRSASAAKVPPAGWRDRTACTTDDIDLFFPTGSQQQIATQTAEAKDLCAICPVRTACLDWAMATRQEAGIWGGLTEDERRKRGVWRWRREPAED